MVELVTRVRHQHLMHDRTEGRGVGVDVNHSEPVGCGTVGAEHQRVGQRLGGRFHRQSWRGVERGIGPG